MDDLGSLAPDHVGPLGDDGNAFLGFSPDGDNGDGTFGSWGTCYPKKMRNAADHAAMQIDPARDIMVVVASALNGIYAIDPSAPDRDIVPLVCAGDRPVITTYAAIESRQTSTNSFTTLRTMARRSIRLRHPLGQHGHSSCPALGSGAAFATRTTT